MKMLSKSRYLNGLQCPKLLWTSVNAKYQLPEVDASTQFVFDEGHKVGELAHSLYPDGIQVPVDDFAQNLKLSRQYLSLRKPLFEPGFSPGRLYSRIDILVPAGDDDWDLVEVKSSTEPKEVNYHDVSFQRHCCHEAGLEINRCFLVHINKQYVRQGNIDPRMLFKIKDITE